MTGENEIASWDDVIENEQVSFCEDNRTIMYWIRLFDGRGAVCQFELGALPG